MANIDYVLVELRDLLLKVEIQDRQRGKKRYVSKVSAIRDVIKLLEQIKDN